MSHTSQKEGLPQEAHAIEGKRDDTSTWKLPHHTQALIRLIRRHGCPSAEDVERTVNWECMAAAVAALSPGGFRGQRVAASAEQILEAARHMAAHYRSASKPVPDTLQALL